MVVLTSDDIMFQDYTSLKCNKPNNPTVLPTVKVCILRTSGQTTPLQHRKVYVIMKKGKETASPICPVITFFDTRNANVCVYHIHVILFSSSALYPNSFQLISEVL